MNEFALFSVVFILGLEFGSFANVCIYRWPRDGSVFKPSRSFCPWCKHKLSWWENIPLASYLALSGRCRHCKSTISIRYPVVELTMPLLWLLFTPQLQPVTIEWALIFKIAVYFYIFAMVVTFFTDVDWKIIPDEVSYSLLMLGILSSPWNHLSGLTTTLQRLQNAGIGIAVGAGTLILISEIGRLIMKKEVMGWGDIKLLGAMGSLLGAKSILITLFIASLLGSVFAIGGLLLKMLKRNQYIPFGPFLNTAGLLVLWIMLTYPDLMNKLWQQ